MFAVPLKADGVTIEPIMPVDGGAAHFFTEYFDAVSVAEEYRLGQEKEGWIVAQRLLFHERNATAGVGFGFGLSGGNSAQSEFNWRLNIQELVKRHGGMDNPLLANRVTSDYINQIVAEHLATRINDGLQNGKLQGHWGSLLKLGLGIDAPTNADVALAVAGADGVIWKTNEIGGEIGLNWLSVRGVSIAGGSNEIQRNIVSERLLDLPREPGHSKDTPFRELMKQI
jgi:alkylation response protein AidB-like acyl-CoA dehydrogenase